MNELVESYVVMMAKSLKGDDNELVKEQKVNAFFADILGDYRGGHLSEKDVKFLHKLIRAFLGWEF